MHWRTCASIIAAMLALAAVLRPAGRDVAVRLNCAGATQCPAGFHGVLLVSKAGIRKDIRSANNDATFSGIDNTYTQVMAFRTGYKPAYEKDVVWKGASDPLRLNFENRVRLNIRIWVICPDSKGDCDKPLTAKREAQLKRFVTKANAVLDSETVGIQLAEAGGVLISDNATTRSAASTYAKFKIDQCSAFATWATKAQGVTWLPEVVNIYLVSTVRAKPGNGINCSRGVPQLIVVGAGTTWGTILHEVGHSLSLQDLPNPDVAWDGDQLDNFMRSESRQRKYFTEGEIYRIYQNDVSFLKGVDPPNFYCGSSDADADKQDPPCPKLQERVWPER